MNCQKYRLQIYWMKFSFLIVLGGQSYQILYQCPCRHGSTARRLVIHQEVPYADGNLALDNHGSHPYHLDPWDEIYHVFWSNKNKYITMISKMYSNLQVGQTWGRVTRAPSIQATQKSVYSSFFLFLFFADKSIKVS